jgi:hypothetical protein
MEGRYYTLIKEFMKQKKILSSHGYPGDPGNLLAALQDYKANYNKSIKSLEQLTK